MLADDDRLEDDKVMEKIYRLQTKLKFKAFGKTKLQTEKARKKEEAVEKKSEAEEAKELLARQSKRIEEQ